MLMASLRRFDANVTSDFFWQTPRYKSSDSWNPGNVLMTYNILTECTTYIIFLNEELPYLQRVQARLEASFSHFATTTGRGFQLDPFLLNTMIIHEHFMGALSTNRHIRDRLYEGLFKVETYAKTHSKREDLELLTGLFHNVSQDADFLVASMETSDAILRAMQSAHQRLEALYKDGNCPPHVAEVGDSIEYLLGSVRAQRQSTNSYKSRKDIAMNLVSRGLCLWAIRLE